MGYVLKAVLSSAQHPEYGQITVPFPIPDEKYDRMIELLEPLEIGDALRQDCRVDELDSFYTVLNRLVGSLVNFDELDYLAKRLDSFDDGEAAQFQGMACKLGVSNIKDFINLTFCCQQATVITDFSDLDAIGRQHYMTMQGGGCRIEELERLDGRKFALDLILNHLEGRITPYGVVYYEYTPEKKRVLKHGGYLYQLDPYALEWKNDHYYLIGFSHKHQRMAHFRVDRLSGIKILPSGFTPDEDFDVAGYTNKIVDMFAADRTVSVELLCENKLMKTIIDHYGEAVPTRTYDEEHFTANIEVDPSGTFYGWVFKFMGGIQIIAPHECVEEMKRIAHRFL